MKRLLLFSFLLFACRFYPQGDPGYNYCVFPDNGNYFTDGPVSPPISGTINMAILLCVEKGQSPVVDLATYVNRLITDIPDYFNKTTFNHFHVNVTSVLVKSTDLVHGIASVFELPDTLMAYPPLDSN